MAAFAVNYLAFGATITVTQLIGVFPPASMSAETRTRLTAVGVEVVAVPAQPRRQSVAT